MYILILAYMLVVENFSVCVYRWAVVDTITAANTTTTTTTTTL